MEIPSSQELDNEESAAFKTDLSQFINHSVETAVEASMTRVSKHMENSLMSLMTKALAHSAGESRKRKLVPSTSLSKNVSLLGHESSSHLTEDVVPSGSPTKEGFKIPMSKSKSKAKHVEVPKKLVIDTIPDTDDDDDMGDTDDLTDFFQLVDPLSPKKARLDAFASQPVLDTEGNPMFDPSTIRHPNSTEWFPTPHVGEYISSKLRLPLDKSVRAKLKSECPKPSLPCHVTVTPTIDQPLLTFFSKFGKDPRKGVDKAWSTCQDKLLDVVGPLARVLDMAETARLEGSDLDPEEISLWLQRSFCLLGNANAAIIHERRKGLLIKLDPKLANLASQDPGVKADRLLFGDSLVKDLSRYVSTFASLDKAQFSIKKVFASRVFGRDRSFGRGYQNQGSRGAANSSYQEFKPQFYPAAEDRKASVPTTATSATKVMRPVVSYLRSLGIRLIIYLDDILIMHTDKQTLLSHLDVAQSLLLELGFLINSEKSMLVPSQSVEFLGFRVNSSTASLYLLKTKVSAIRSELCQILRLSEVSLRSLAKSWAFCRLPFKPSFPGLFIIEPYNA
ncbi:uncharacterized protein LOC144762330 [Lissotriton helveticus]